MIPVNLSLNVRLLKRSHKIIPFRLVLTNPGIIRVDDPNQKANIIDMFFYSIGCFTFMSHDQWCPRDNFREFVAIEGAFGWFILGIFMASLANRLYSFQMGT